MTHSLSDTIFVFDLDDTLYSERSYELSGIAAVWKKLLEFSSDISHHISLDFLFENKAQWVELLLQIEPERYRFNREHLLEIYRGHLPTIELYEDAARVLSYLVENRAQLAMITDGRSLSQRQKLKALKIEHLFNPILISEETGYHKPHSASYESVEAQFPRYQYVYVGDNPKKDFVTPNKLGWYTYGLKDRGNNVHAQLVKANEQIFLPRVWLNTFIEIIPHILL